MNLLSCAVAPKGTRRPTALNAGSFRIFGTVRLRRSAMGWHCSHSMASPRPNPSDALGPAELHKTVAWTLHDAIVLNWCVMAIVLKQVLPCHVKCQNRPFSSFCFYFATILYLHVIDCVTLSARLVIHGNCNTFFKYYMYYDIQVVGTHTIPGKH